MEVEEFLKEASVMKEVKHPNLVQLLGQYYKLIVLHCCRFVLIYLLFENYLLIPYSVPRNSIC